MFPEPVSREEKPDFSAVPASVSCAIEKAVGAKITDARKVFGSFSASAGFAISFDDGRCIFAKGNHPGEMAHGAENLRQEIFAYKNIPGMKDIAPAYLGFVGDGDDDGWHLGLWEFIGPEKDFAPSPALVAEAALKIGKFDPQFLQRVEDKKYMQGFLRDEKKWKRMAEEEKPRAKFIAMFEDPVAAEKWLARSLPALLQLQKDFETAPSPRGLIHGDLRLDNLIFTADKTFIVDWPNACEGPLVIDLVFLFSHTEALGVAKAEEILQAYAAIGGDDFSTVWPAALAGISGYFADQACREVPKTLPRLRWMQKSLLLAQLRGLERRGIVESIPVLSGQQR